MTISRVRSRVWAVGATTLLAVAVLTGCADDNPVTFTPPPSSTYQGGYADDGNGRGGLNFTISAATVQAAEKVLGGSAVSATGQVHPAGGADVALTGFYDPTTFTITLAQVAKGASTYSLSGVLTGGEFHGSISTPTGNGGFAAVPVSTVQPDTIYCGVYNCDSCPGGGGGFFDSIVFGSSVVIGVRNFASSTTIPLAGTVAGNTISVDDQGITATGTISGESVVGTYAIPADSENGSWNGSTAACAAGLRR